MKTNIKFIPVIILFLFFSNVSAQTTPDYWELYERGTCWEKIEKYLRNKNDRFLFFDETKDEINTSVYIYAMKITEDALNFVLKKSNQNDYTKNVYENILISKYIDTQIKFSSKENRMSYTGEFHIGTESNSSQKYFTKENFRKLTEAAGCPECLEKIFDFKAYQSIDNAETAFEHMKAFVTMYGKDTESGKMISFISDFDASVTYDGTGLIFKSYLNSTYWGPKSWFRDIADTNHPLVAGIDTDGKVISVNTLSTAVSDVEQAIIEDKYLVNTNLLIFLDQLSDKILDSNKKSN